MPGLHRLGWDHDKAAGGSMTESTQPQRPDANRPFRKTLRLTFRVADTAIRLESHERVDMICPPSIGERPEPGRHGGFWMELHDAHDRVLFHRILETPLGDSVEVHSPDGKIERVFGAVREHVFEVLLPDDSRAKTIVFIGESLEPVTARKEQRPARELARFNIPEGVKGGKPETRGRQP
jgi:hypothetical protein